MKAQIYKTLTSLPIIGKPFADWNHRRHMKIFAEWLHKTPPVFIYQSGKVGSSTLRRSIRPQYEGAVIADHNLENGFHWHTDVLCEEYQKQKFPMKVITPIREPIGRNISAFFQNFERFTGVKFEESQHSMEELTQFFFDNVGHSFPITFFDNHIHKHFDIDVYATPFPKENYALYEKGDITLLVLKYDLDGALKNQIIGDFIGNKSFRIEENRNVSAKKPYASAYVEMQKRSLPKWYLDKMLNNKYMQHFYEKDIEQLRNKWS